MDVEAIKQLAQEFGLSLSGPSIESSNGGLYRRRRLSKLGYLSFRVAFFEDGNMYAGIDGESCLPRELQPSEFCELLANKIPVFEDVGTEEQEGLSEHETHELKSLDLDGHGTWSIVAQEDTPAADSADSSRFVLVMRLDSMHDWSFAEPDESLAQLPSFEIKVPLSPSFHHSFEWETWGASVEEDDEGEGEAEQEGEQTAMDV